MYRFTLLTLAALCFSGCYGEKPKRVMNVYDMNKGSALMPPAENAAEPAESSLANSIDDPAVSNPPLPTSVAENPIQPTPSIVPAESASSLPGLSREPIAAPSVAPQPEPSIADLAGSPIEPADAADIAPALPPEAVEHLRPQLPDDPGTSVQAPLVDEEAASAGPVDEDVKPASNIEVETEIDLIPSPPEVVPAADPGGEKLADNPPEENDEGDQVSPVLPIDQASELRTWSDSTGRLRIQARFVRFEKQSAILETSDGDELRIPIKRFSRHDQRFLDQVKRGDFGI